jgi:hypothetical protein
MRRLIAITAIVVILAAAWTAGWFWLAAWADRNAGSALAEIRERGFAVECEDREIVGFPFAMRIACASAEVTEERSGLAAEVAGATGGASVFAPTAASVELSSPARIAGAPLTEPADVRWEEAAVSIGIGMNGPREVSFDTAALATRLALAGLPPLEVSVGDAEGSISPAPAGGTAVAGTFSNVTIRAGGTLFPTFDGALAATLSAPPRALATGRLEPPIAAEDIDASLASGAARITVAGALSVDAEGIADGELQLRIAGVDALPAIIEALPEEYRKPANAVAGGLIAFGRPTTLDGQPASELVVTITRGEAKVGPVEVTLPRLPL